MGLDEKKRCVKYNLRDKRSTRVLTSNILNENIVKSKRSTRVLTSNILNENIVKSKRSQITLYIIFAIAIVALLILAFLFRGKILPYLPISSGFDVNAYLTKCIDKPLADSIALVGIQGGSISPSNYVSFQGEKIEYLCYINEYYKTCVMQQPLLKQHIEFEIRKNVKAHAQNCVADLVKELEKRNYNVVSGSSDLTVELLPKNIAVTLNAPMTITKGESSTAYKTFKLNFKSGLYDLVMISTSILNFEARYGDSETTAYMAFYPHIKVEKKTREDSTKIYILTNRNTGEKFQFASRSVAWPAGYGIGLV